MKTFIWNREYEVVAASAETVEQARELIKPMLSELLDPEVAGEIARSVKYLKEADPLSENYRDKDWWERNIKYTRESIEKQKAIIYNNPDVVIEENQAIIFDHLNE